MRPRQRKEVWGAFQHLSIITFSGTSLETPPTPAVASASVLTAPAPRRGPVLAQGGTGEHGPHRGTAASTMQPKQGAGPLGSPNREGGRPAALSPTTTTPAAQLPGSRSHSAADCPPGRGPARSFQKPGLFQTERPWTLRPWVRGRGDSRATPHRDPSLRARGAPARPASVMGTTAHPAETQPKCGRAETQRPRTPSPWEKKAVPQRSKNNDQEEWRDCSR